MNHSSRDIARVATLARADARGRAPPRARRLGSLVVDADAEAARPSVRVVAIERLLTQLEGGEASVEPILMPASETAELVKGRTLGNKVSQPRE